jgi:hypothetical protein
MEDEAAQYPEEMLQLMRKFPGAEPADILQLIAVSICMPLCFLQPISSTEKKICVAGESDGLLLLLATAL